MGICNKVHNHEGGKSVMVPVITKMEVYPVAGHDSMLLNLSGGHAPYLPATS